MVALSDLEHINMLYAEIRQIQLAMRAFESDGRILSMEIGWLDDDGSPFPAARVPTIKLDYPAAMVTQIRTGLEARLGQIDQELAQLGVTGAVASLVEESRAELAKVRQRLAH